MGLYVLSKNMESGEEPAFSRYHLCCIDIQYQRHCHVPYAKPQRKRMDVGHASWHVYRDLIDIKA